MAIDWARVRFTEHMTEAAAVVGECHVVLDFPGEQASYAITVYEALKGGGEERYFAVGNKRDDAHAFRPSGGGATPEQAIEQCLANAGIYHRRHVKQRGG